MIFWKNKNFAFFVVFCFYEKRFKYTSSKIDDDAWKFSLAENLPRVWTKKHVYKMKMEFLSSDKVQKCQL